MEKSVETSGGPGDDDAGAARGIDLEGSWGVNAVKVTEAAGRLEVSPATIYSLVTSGRLRCYRVGNGRGVIRISEAHLADYLASAQPESPSPVAPAPVPQVKLKHIRVS